MTIQDFSNKLQASLESKLSDTDPVRDELVKIGKALTMIREAVAELKKFTLSYKFKTEHEEITFFKYVKPGFICHYIFFRKVFAIKLFDSFRDRIARETNYATTLQKLSRYASRHQSLYEYWITGSSDLDRHYFLRDFQNERLIEHDEKFSTGFDVRLGKLMANDRFREYVLSLNNTLTNAELPGSLKWTGSKASLIELIYAIHSAKVINDGKADIKEIAGVIETNFNISLGNYYRYFQDIRARKVNPTVFLDELRQSLRNHIDSANE